jgi:ribosome maturation factor RimP
MTGRDHPHVPAERILGNTLRGPEGVASAVRRVVEPILASLGLTLVAVEVRGRGPKTLIRVVIERLGSAVGEAEGIFLGDCERVHGLLGPALDVEDPIPHAYVLEVSSPGLDRPIRGPGDYERFKGRLARFKLAQPVLGQSVLIGRIQKLEGSVVWVDAVPAGRGRGEPTPIALPLGDIREARLEVEF